MQLGHRCPLGGSVCGTATPARRSRIASSCARQSVVQNTVVGPSPVVAADADDAAGLEILQLRRREVLRAAACLMGLGAWSATPRSAVAATSSLPGNAVPGASIIPDGDVSIISPSQVVALRPSERQTYAQNLRVQAQNRTPDGFPGFIRTGFDVKVVGEGLQVTPSGLIYQDFTEGEGDTPVDGQEVVFHYTGYNESGKVIDTSYRQGRPAQTRLGIAGMIPGFEEGIRGMRVGQLRRIIVPPALGPPVGPSTFFSAKQCEVFDVELLAIRTCTRRQLAMFSDVVCT